MISKLNKRNLKNLHHGKSYEKLSFRKFTHKRQSVICGTERTVQENSLIKEKN